MTWTAQLAAAVLVFALGGWTGMAWEQGRAAQRQKDAQDAVVAAAAGQAVADGQAGAVRARAAAGYRDKSAKAVERIRYETVEVPVYRDCRVSDDGLRELRGLVDTANAAGGSAAAVPGAAAAR